MLTVGIPCYRGEDIALGAVTSARRQIHSNVEVILCDDGSPPDSHERLKKLASSTECRFIRTEGRGLPSAYNALVDAAKYPYVLLLDNDAMISPITANVIVHFFQNNRVGVLGIAAKRITHEEYFVNCFKGIEPQGTGRIERATQLAGYCFAFAKYHWQEVGGFDPSYGFYLADSDFCCNLAKKKIPSYRIHWPMPEHLEHATLDEHKELKAKERLAKDLLYYSSKWGRIPEEMETKLLSKIRPSTVQHIYRDRVLRTQVGS